MEHAANLPEYPETDLAGFNYIVYVGGQDVESVTTLMQEV
jgi:hypothetical protein